MYIYEFAGFLRAHVPGFEEATLHVVAPLTCARGGKSIARMLLPVQVDGSQRQAEDLRPLQVQAHRDLPSRQRAQIAAATPGDHASQLVTDQRIGSVETAAGQAIDQLRRQCEDAWLVSTHALASTPCRYTHTHTHTHTHTIHTLQHTFNQRGMRIPGMPSALDDLSVG